jgi:hypothetical protein
VIRTLVADDQEVVRAGFSALAADGGGGFVVEATLPTR